MFVKKQKEKTIFTFSPFVRKTDCGFLLWKEKEVEPQSLWQQSKVFYFFSAMTLKPTVLYSIFGRRRKSERIFGIFFFQPFAICGGVVMWNENDGVIFFAVRICAVFLIFWFFCSGIIGKYFILSVCYGILSDVKRFCVVACRD